MSGKDCHYNDLLDNIDNKNDDKVFEDAKSFFNDLKKDQDNRTKFKSSC